MIKLLILLTLTKVIGGSLPPDDADNVLHIGGIFPIGGKGGWQGGQVSNKYYIILYFPYLKFFIWHFLKFFLTCIINIVLSFMHSLTFK